MSQLNLFRWLRILTGIGILVVVTVGTYLASKYLNLTHFQILYAVASIFLTTIVLLWGMGMWSMPLPRSESELDEMAQKPPERSKHNASVD